MPRRIKIFYLSMVYIFLYLPIVVMIVYSFNLSRYTYNSAWTGFTLRWYEALFSNEQLIDATLNSLMVAASASTIATVLGALAALCIHRFRFLGRRMLHGAIYILAVSPDIVMGISLLIFFIVLNMELGFVTLLIAHVTLCLPFVAVTILARLSEFDEHYIEAARDLGASEVQAFRYIVLPLSMPAVIAGWLLSFTLSMDDVLISVFVTGPSFEVLPIRIYSMVRTAVKPDINALSAIMFIFTLVLVLSAQAILKRRKKS